MIYGYVRVSTAHQNVENGRFEIANFAEKSGFSIDKWVVEQISSRESLSKRKLGAVIKKLKEGDILLTTEISRLGRNLMEIMGILNVCLSKKCQIWTIKENYRLGFDIQSKVLAFAFGLSAEIERNLISERTKESLHRLKSSGKRLGRPRGSGKAMRRLHSQRERIKALLERGETKREVARIACVSEATLYRFLRVCGVGEAQSYSTRNLCLYAPIRMFSWSIAHFALNSASNPLKISSLDFPLPCLKYRRMSDILAPGIASVCL